MKPLWTQTLAWLAAVAVALLLALVGPEAFDRVIADPIPQGSTAPR
jgi:multisubunit Na+/H+ antiporter MnhF subunit